MAIRTRTAAGTLVPLPLGTRTMPKVVAHGDRSRRMVQTLLSHTRATLRLTMRKQPGPTVRGGRRRGSYLIKHLAVLNCAPPPHPGPGPGRGGFREAILSEGE